jgi:hypothetical protein
MTYRIATGFDMEPLGNGNILIEFCGDNGVTFNKQVITREVLECMPAVIPLILVCLDQGVDEVERIMKQVNERIAK